MLGMDKLVNLSRLDFPNNLLTDECIDVLTKSIANKKIQELNLSNNKVGSESPRKPAKGRVAESGRYGRYICAIFF